MPRLNFDNDGKLTAAVEKRVKALIADLPLPEKGYVIHMLDKPQHLGVRVASTGSKAWVLDRRLDGKTVRRTLGDADGARALTLKQAVSEFCIVNGKLLAGEDEVAAERAERQAQAAVEREGSLTLTVALQEYCAGKKRFKDGLLVALKARTKAEYSAMVEPGGTFADGRPKQDGMLCAFAATPITKITGGMVRDHFHEMEKRGAYRASYAMRVLRAVLNHHGVQVPDSPMSKAVPAKDRIMLTTARATGKAITGKFLGAWWKASGNAGRTGIGGDKEAADMLRLMLLTGCRGVEIKGDAFGNDPIRVRDVDFAEGRIVVKDTKNRKDHALLLSTQAMEIVKRRIEGKTAGDALFDIADAGKTMHAINRAAGLNPAEHSPHDLRATFVSLAAVLCDQFTAKKLVNHSDKGDVTTEHYIRFDDEHLRGAWQKVADFIEAKAAAIPVDTEALIVT